MRCHLPAATPRRTTAASAAVSAGAPRSRASTMSRATRRDRRSSPYCQIMSARVTSSTLVSFSASVCPRDRSIRISSGPACRKLNPRSGSSSCIEDTPRSASTPSTRGTPRAASTSPIRSCASCTSSTRSPQSANLLCASPIACSSRSMPITRPAPASRSAWAWPAQPDRRVHVDAVSPRRDERHDLADQHRFVPRLRSRTPRAGWSRHP